MGKRKLGTNPGQPHSEEVCGTKRNLKLKKIHLPTKDTSIPFVMVGTNLLTGIWTTDSKAETLVGVTSRILRPTEVSKGDQGNHRTFIILKILA